MPENTQKPTPPAPAVLKAWMRRRAQTYKGKKPLSVAEATAAEGMAAAFDADTRNPKMSPAEAYRRANKKLLTAFGGENKRFKAVSYTHLTLPTTPYV